MPARQRRCLDKKLVGGKEEEERVCRDCSLFGRWKEEEEEEDENERGGRRRLQKGEGRNGRRKGKLLRGANKGPSFFLFEKKNRIF